MKAGRLFRNKVGTSARQLLVPLLLLGHIAADEIRHGYRSEHLVAG